jgi:RNA polymerase sigma-70 factor (ECF subfamily)
LDIDEIIQQYFPRIHRAALVLCGNPWDADDLAQETFLVLSRQLDRFEGRSSLYTYLYGILLNLDRRERRRYGMRRRKLQVLWDNEPSQPRTTPAADASAEVKEWKNSLWGRVARDRDRAGMPLGHRKVAHLSRTISPTQVDGRSRRGCPHHA